MNWKWNGQNYLNWCWEGKLLFDLDVKVGRFSVRQSLLTLWLDWTPQAERPGSTLATWNWQLTTCAWSHDWREPVGQQLANQRRDLGHVTSFRPMRGQCCPGVSSASARVFQSWRDSRPVQLPLLYESNRFFNLCICISYICWSRLF